MIIYKIKKIWQLNLLSLSNLNRFSLIVSLLFLITFSQNNCQAAAAQKATCINISGNLMLKGSEPGAWWALADDQGRIWKITSPTPEQVIFFQKMQNQRITLQGRKLNKYLNFEQIQPCHVADLVF